MVSLLTLLRRLLGTTTKTIRCVYYGPADIHRVNGRIKAKGKVVIIPFPGCQEGISDFVGIYEIVEE